MGSRLGWAAAAALLAVTAVPPVAAHSPQLLQRDYDRCYQSCLDDQAAERCTALCRCTIDAFAQDLSPADYLTLTSQIAQNRLSVENRIFVDEVALACVIATTRP